MDNARSLWVAVVLQARDDLDGEKRNSIIYNQAVSFFFHGGEWATSRREISDFLDLHPDDLTRLGRETLAARNERDGVSCEQRAQASCEQRAQASCEQRAYAACVQCAQASCEQRRAAGAAVAGMMRPVKTPCQSTLNPERRDRQWWVNRFLAGQRLH